MGRGTSLYQNTTMWLKIKIEENTFHELFYKHRSGCTPQKSGVAPERPDKRRRMDCRMIQEREL